MLRNMKGQRRVKNKPAAGLFPERGETSDRGGRSKVKLEKVS
jgi:hypothetical protein